jgi:TonB family protein
VFDVLPASDAHLDVRRSWVTTSFAAHAVVIAAAVVLTRGALQGARTPAAEDTMQLYVAPTAPAPPALPAPELPGTQAPDGFQTIPPLSEVPPAIPPIDLSRRPFDARDFLRIGSNHGVAAPPGRTESGGGIYDAGAQLEGFDPAVLLSQPRPSYPAVLQSAGVAGSVLVEFVIDTVGNVERASVHMIETSHPAFEDSAREAVLGARFRPARLAGRPVRQITRQRVRFVASN